MSGAEAIKKCPSCGETNFMKATQCIFCGAALEAAHTPKELLEYPRIGGQKPEADQKLAVVPGKAGTDLMIFYALTGAVVGAVSLFPLTLFLIEPFSKALKHPGLSDTDDLMGIVFCWLPAAVLGAPLALAAGRLLRRRSNAYVAWLGALGGGLVGGLVMALVLLYSVFAG
jgi:hypothetical protein